ncbi:v-type proton atpase 16 kda proteolipid subunit [Anaeramoeba ignava]|nr:v-type proton atpase 16 kda proteolipid subunit [Anaeramoeba ignava]
MASIIGIYGLIIAVIITTGITEDNYPKYLGFSHLAAGLAVGLSGLGAGMTIGIVGDAGVRGYASQNKIFVAMILILIFAEALALYGLIIGLILGSRSSSAKCNPNPAG